MATVTAVPSRSLQQRMEALNRANAVRSHRKVLKFELKHRGRSVVDVLLAPESEVESMLVFDLLLARPHWGRVKVARTLRTCGIAPSKSVGGLSDRQRRELVGMLGGR